MAAKARERETLISRGLRSLKDRLKAAVSQEHPFLLLPVFYHTRQTPHTVL